MVMILCAASSSPAFSAPTGVDQNEIAVKEVKVRTALATKPERHGRIGREQSTYGHSCTNFTSMLVW